MFRWVYETGVRSQREIWRSACCQSPEETELLWGEDVQRVNSKAAPGALDIQSSGSGEDPAKGTAKEQPV